MYKHILVALDGSKVAEQALPHALEIARLMDSRVTLFSIVEPYMIAMPATPAPLPAYDAAADVEMLVREREDYLKTVAERLPVNHDNVDVISRSGAPASEIIAYCKDNDVDLIVMTTHGRTGIRRFIYGSVAQAVLNESHLPVLMIRAEHEE